jgi:very-short-patch-repair endonuclease
MSTTGKHWKIKDNSNRLGKKYALGKHWILSDESKANVSKGVLETFKNGRVVHNKGKTKDNYEPLAKVSKSLTGYVKSKEHIENLKKSFIGRKNNRNYIEGSRLGGINCQKTIKKSNTRPERILSEILDSLSIKHISQYPLLNITVTDEFLPEYKIAIYADGDYWHTKPGKKEKDEKVNIKLIENGYKVFRFWEKDLVHNQDKVKMTISNDIVRPYEKSYEQVRNILALPSGKLTI